MSYYSDIKDKKERVVAYDESIYKDNTEWHVILGAWRTSEFFRLLNKIQTRDFDNLTLGEFWLVDDLLDAIHERRLADEL